MKALPAVICLFALLSCRALPGIDPVSPSARPFLLRGCENVFLKTSLRVIHAIDASMPGGNRAVIIGISVIHPSRMKIHSVLMTLEGLVLFDAEYDGKTKINRAVPPFDSADFAEGLMSDIRLMFLQPGVPPEDAGSIKGSRHVCRYRPEGKIIDLITNRDGDRELRLYSDKRILLRQVTYSGFNEEGLAAKIKLKATGLGGLGAFGGYTLSLRLIEFQHVKL